MRRGAARASHREGPKCRRARMRQGELHLFRCPTERVAPRRRLVSTRAVDRGVLDARMGCKLTAHTKVPNVEGHHCPEGDIARYQRSRKTRTTTRSLLFADTAHHPISRVPKSHVRCIPDRPVCGAVLCFERSQPPRSGTLRTQRLGRCLHRVSCRGRLGAYANGDI